MSAVRGGPPQALEAEGDLLGACMMSGEAIRAALGGVEAADFYDPKHQAIYAAIQSLAHRGAAVDPATVADELGRSGDLDRIGGRATILRIQAATPASANAVYYAETVARSGALRRAVGVAEELRHLAITQDLDGVEELLGAAPERVSAPLGLVEPGMDLADVLRVEVPEPEWVIPGCLARRDRLMVTGEEGRGKSTLLRQIGIQVACGVHPWTLVGIDRKRILHVDMENSAEQSAAEYAKIANPSVRRRYEPGWLAVKYRPQGLDLARRSDVRWLEGLVAHHQPDLLAIGPLYKMIRGRDRMGVHSEEIAAEVARALDEIRVRHDVALLIEAHSPHIAQGAKKRDLRPIGASLWLRWAEFGVGLSVGQDGVAKLDRWRLDRVRHRVWPSELRPDGPMWPWSPPEVF